MLNLTNQRAGKGGLLFILTFLIPLILTANGHKLDQNKIPKYYSQYTLRENEGSSSRAQLRNGIRVIVEEYSPRPISAVTMVIETGHGDEKEAEIETASCLAREIIFKGEFSQKLIDIGGLLTVDVRKRETLFTVVMPTRNVLKSLESMDIILEKPLQGEISKKHSIGPLVSRKKYEDWFKYKGEKRKLWHLVDVGARSGEMGKAVIRASGVPESVSDKKIQNFHEKYYQPGNTSIIVSSGILRERVLEKIAEVYSKHKSVKAIVEENIQIEPKVGFLYKSHQNKKGLTRILFNYRAPPLSDQEMAVLQLIEASLSGSDGLLEFNLSQEKLNIIHEVRWRPGYLRDPFSITVFPYGDNIEQVEVSVLAVLESLAKEGLDPNDLQRAKSQLTLNHFSRLRSNEERTRILYRQSRNNEWSDLTLWPRQLAEISNEEVKEVAGKCFRRSQLTLIEDLSIESPIRAITSKSIKEYFDLLVPNAIEKILSKKKMRWSIDSTDFVVPEIPIGKQASQLKKTSVLRGPEILQEEERSSPIIDIGLFFPGGRANEIRENQGITELMLNSLVKNRGKTWEELTQVGRELEIVNEPDFFGIRTQIFSRDLQNTLAEMINWIRKARISPRLFSSSLKTISLIQKIEKQDLFWSGKQEVRKIFFPNHSYGLNRYGTEESLPRLKLSSVEEWQKKYMRNIHPLIVIFGDLEGSSFLLDLIPILSSSKYRYTKLQKSEMFTKVSDSHLVRIGEKWVLAGISGPALGTRDDWIMDVIINLLKLKQLSPVRIGEVQLSHDINFESQGFLKTGIVYISWPVHDKKVEKQTILKQLSELGEISVTQELLKKCLVLTLTQHYRDGQKGSEYLMNVASNFLAFKKSSYQVDYQTNIKSLGFEDLQLVVKRYFQSLTNLVTAMDSPRNQ